jgi:sugar phosphate isomerase/epimerase
MGYGYVQYSGIPLGAETVKRVTERAGLPVKLTHVPLERLLSDTDNLVREHDLLGCEYIGLGSIDRARIKTPGGAVETIRMLEGVAVALRGKGKKFLYHNHNFEFIKYPGGKTFYDLMIENTEELGFILDTYWVQMGGVSIPEYIAKLKGRIDCVHLKDFKVEDMTPRFAALGDGNIDFPTVIKAMKKSGAKYFFVEQDDAGSYPDPFGEVGKSINYLKALKF